MINAILVDATDLPLWATCLDAQATLPQLLRRLVLAGEVRVEHIDFRAGEGVQLEGWDGLVEAGSGSAFVPDGVSGWEMGTNRAVKNKADGDYAKRLADPLGLEPDRTTFIFVTPRRWRNKAAWAMAKRREGRWKDVRAYDADDMATWLEQMPAVHIWFSKLVGKHPAGAQDLSWYWAAWAGATQPRLSPELVIAGRQSAVDEIQQWLGGQPSALGVQGAVRDEAVAFLAAVLQQMPEQEREPLLARCVVVEDTAIWQHLATSRTPLILVPTFADRVMVSQAVTAGHHVFIPLDRSEPALGKAVQLPRIGRDAARAALEEMGIARDPAEELATLARRSLAALRRKRASTPAVLTPLWAEPQAARALLPALLAGRWRDDHSVDREVITRLATRDYRDYNEVSETLLRWANAADPPVRRVGDTWMVVSSEDAWSLLAPALTRDDLERFEAVVLDILGAVDPRYELPLGERWAAAIYGRTLSHSSDLREGLAEALALMGASSDLYPLADVRTGQAWAMRTVRRLFQNAQDWSQWASLAGHLPLLAEAAPDEFLAAVERGLTGEPPMLVNLFTDGENHLLESSPHTGLLWALELLAWSPEYLGHTAMLLAKLARLDPGGTLNNLPMRSLQLIFLCWRPGTSATLEQRLRVLDSLRQREPQVAWSLLVSLLPGRIRTAFNTAEPRWRPWLPDERPTTMTYGELFRVTQELSQRLITRRRH